MAKGGYPMKSKGIGGGSGSMKYNHGSAAGMPGSGKTTKSTGNVVGTRLPGGGSPRKGKAKRTGGKGMGMAY